jgi:hypothetical protein
MIRSESENRSPERIREYFELLRWKKNGCGVYLLPEAINSSELLLSIKALLEANVEVINSTNSSISSREKTKLSNRELIQSVEQEINSIEHEILSIRRARLSDIEATIPFQESEFPTPASSRLPKIPELSSGDAYKQLLENILLDVRKSVLGAIQCFNENPIITSFIGISTFGIALFFSLNFNFLFNLILLVSIGLYIRRKLNHIYEQHRRTWKERLANVDLERQQRLRHEIESRLQSERQRFEVSLQDFEGRLQERRERLQELRGRQNEIEEDLRADQQQLTELEEFRQQKLEEYQDKIEELKLQEQDAKKARLLNLEEKVQRWLGDDIERLTHKAMKKLKIIPPSDNGELNALQNEPIRVLIGITERTFQSVIVESDSDLNLEGIENPELYIESKDFESEPSYDGNSRKYGVYEFLVIFLCANFLVYYKCYLNFIRGQAVDEETCEYLYDSIVSVKIQEKSSVRLKNEKQKNIYRKRLLITTKDGKIVCFRIARNRVDKTHSLRLSQIDEAALAIRDMLRQRRVDITLTENFSDD